MQNYGKNKSVVASMYGCYPARLQIGKTNLLIVYLFIIIIYCLNITNAINIIFKNNHDNMIDIDNLQVTPPEEPLPVLGVPCVSGGILPSGYGGFSGGASSSGIGDRMAGSSSGSTLGVSSMDSCISSPLQPEPERPQQSAPSPQHLQGTIV